MRSFIFTIITLFISLQFTQAQQPTWVWATSADTINNAGVNYPQHVVAASGASVMWGELKKSKMIYGQQSIGDYNITQYDTAGTPGASITIGGKIALLDAQCDATGNYYFLGTYFDSLRFVGGPSFSRDPFTSTSANYFVFRLDKNTLALKWFHFIGADYTATTSFFTIRNGALYMPVDSGGFATLYNYDLNTGNRLAVLKQSGSPAFLSSVDVDNDGNIYVTGLASNTANFNGHTLTIPSSSSYPNYIVRYHANGQYDWSIFMHDVTLAQRKVTVLNNNQIYYSGSVDDTLTLGTFHLHRAQWVSDFLVAMLDSNGQVHWVTQLNDSLHGDAMVSSATHTTLNPDSSLSVLTRARGNINWGNGVSSTNSISGGVTVANYNTAGAVNWTMSSVGLSVSATHMATNGYNTWVTGNGYDSTAIHFGSHSVPTFFSYSSTPYLSRFRLAHTTGVQGSLNPFTYSLSPNPAAGIIHIKGLEHTSNVSLSITDVSGKIIFTRKLSQPAATEAINVSGYSSGIYYLEVGNATMRHAEKFVVQH
ncbi:MAG: T9SS type A sorting domain-containing protein [Taibaiella sp.]|nr:T9SS type A sorting domain-containing protein [Taibaiella sp.]